MQPKKSLGQHWLKDPAALAAICEAADLSRGDTVLEIGPGLGHLTQRLLERAGEVVAVEIDKDLAAALKAESDSQSLSVINADIMKFDLGRLPPHYKVVANIPYYLTSNLIRLLAESTNPPAAAVLLVQREVAERIAAQPGQMSLLSVSAQYYFETGLGGIVGAELFEPPPKVDSRIIILRYRAQPLFPGTDEKVFFRLAKAGFAGRRKKLRSSLAAGLRRDKSAVDKLLAAAGISGDLRAQNLSLDDWHKLYNAYQSTNM